MMTMSELGWQRPRAATAERNAWQVFSPTLGRESGRVRVLSPAPWLGLIATLTTTYEPPPTRHVERLAARPDVQDLQPGLMPVRFDSWSDETLRFPSEIGELLYRSNPYPTRSERVQDLEQGLRDMAITLAPNQHRAPRFIVTQEANAFADAANVRTDVDILCRLVLRLLPAAEHALMAVVQDLEDGTSSLHVTVRTSAAVDEVVDAEDQLHNAMFDHLTPASRSLFSIGYEFGG